MPDAKAFMDDLYHRRQAIRGARGRADNPMHGRVVKTVVHTHHDIQHACFLNGRCHHDALYSQVEECLQHFLAFEFAGGLDHHIAI